MLTHSFLLYFIPSSSGIPVGSTYKIYERPGHLSHLHCHHPGPSHPHVLPRDYNSLFAGLLLPSLPTLQSTYNRSPSDPLKICQVMSLLRLRASYKSTSTQSKSQSPSSVYRVSVIWVPCNSSGLTSSYSSSGPLCSRPHWAPSRCCFKAFCTSCSLCLDIPPPEVHGQAPLPSPRLCSNVTFSVSLF